MKAGSDYIVEFGVIVGWDWQRERGGEAVGEGMKAGNSYIVELFRGGVKGWAEEMRSCIRQMSLISCQNCCYTCAEGWINTCELSLTQESLSYLSLSQLTSCCHRCQWPDTTTLEPTVTNVTATDTSTTDTLWHMGYDTCDMTHVTWHSANSCQRSCCLVTVMTSHTSFINKHVT